MKSDFSPKSHFSMSAFLKICCIYSEHVFLRTPQTAASLNSFWIIHCSISQSCSLVFPRVHSRSVVLYLFLLVFTCVQLCSTCVHSCIYSCSLVFPHILFVFNRVRLCYLVFWLVYYFTQMILKGKQKNWAFDTYKNKNYINIT